MYIVIYILTMIFALYAIYSVIGSKNKPINTEISTSPHNEEEAEHEETSSEITTVANSNSEVVAPTKDADAGTIDEDNSLRNPITGEIAKIPNNYRFSKRWIKEALVTEELLDKIYKNSELNDEVNTKIKAALETLKTMQKYHV